MRIKELIKEKGYTQKAFAKDVLGMSEVGLAQILAGKPSMSTLEKIASALDVEVWELLVSPEEAASKSGTPNYITCPNCGERIPVEVNIREGSEK